MDPDPLLCSLNYLCGILVQAHQAPITINLPTLGSIFAILVALCGLLLSAFNSGSEIAYFSLTADDVEHIEDERQRSRVAWLLSNPERLLSTILIGNNLVNVMIVIVLNFAMNQIFQFNNAVVDFLVQTVILTFLILLFGEVIPKLYATNNNRTFAVMVSGPLCVAVRLFSPLSRILVKGTGIVSKVVSEKADDISMDDLSHALERSDMKSEEEVVATLVSDIERKTEHQPEQVRDHSPVIGKPCFTAPGALGPREKPLAHFCDGGIPAHNPAAAFFIVGQGAQGRALRPGLSAQIHGKKRLVGFLRWRFFFP